MANSVSTQVLHDSASDAVVKVSITGDGSGDETDVVLVEASALAGCPGELRIFGVHGHLSGFSVTLTWQAARNVDVLDLPADEDFNRDFSGVGGLSNTAGLGRTGDILLSTFELGEDDSGTVVLWLHKDGARSAPEA